MLLSGYYYSFLRFFEEHMMSCPSRKYLGMDCPGCGMQRSMLAMLRGDIAGSLHFHPAGMLMLLTLLFLVLHLVFRFQWGAKALVGMQVTIAIITITFYVYKIIHHQIVY